MIHDVARYLDLQSPVPPRILDEHTNPFDVQLALTANPPDLTAQASQTCDPNNPRDEAVGTINSFFVYDFLIGSYVIKPAILAYKTAHSYVYVELEHFDESNTAEGAIGVVTLNQAKRAGDAFENNIYPVEHLYIGEEANPLNPVENHDHAGLGNTWNDADCDFHVTLLNVQITAPPLILASGGIVAGYFTSADEYPTSTFTFSNEREMVYLNAIFLEVGSFEYNGVVAHEFQHMINWNTDPDEDTWVNEGMSDLAIEITGYSGGTADSHVNAFEAIPDTQLNAWGGANTQELLAHYGAAFAWLSYFMNHYGPTPCVSDFTLARALSHELANGFEGFENVIASRGPTTGYYAGKRSVDVFRDWSLANFLDDPSIDQCQFGYTSLDIQIAFAASHASTATSRLSISRSTNVHQFGTDAIHLFSGATPLDPATLTFNGIEQVKVVPNSPTSPTHEWYSNTGDGLRNTLTRSFDLTAYSGSIVLEYNIWYNTEDGWDYGYVKISTNNGQSWTTLITPFMTNTNPHNNNDGFGYTGMSGFEAVRCGDSGCHNAPLLAAGFTPQWLIDERVDLSAFAGQSVLIRFELETDQALNFDGLSIDDVSLYVNNLAVFNDDVESGPRDWTTLGWILTDTLLEQDFSVRIVKYTGSGTTVSDLLLDDASESGAAQIDVSDAIVFVSGITQPTTVLAGYDYSADGPPGVPPPRTYALNGKILLKEITESACVIGGPTVAWANDKIYWRRGDCGRWTWSISPPDVGKRFTTQVVHESGNVLRTVTPGVDRAAQDGPGNYHAFFSTVSVTPWPAGIYNIRTTVNAPDLGNVATKQFYLNWLETTAQAYDTAGFSRSSFIAGETIRIAGSVNEIYDEFATPTGTTRTPVTATVTIQLVDSAGRFLSTQTVQAQLVSSEDGVNSRYSAQFPNFNPASWTNPITVMVTSTHSDAFGLWTGRASTAFTLSIPQTPTILTYTGDTSGAYSDSATLSARLTHNSGTPLAGQEIKFTLGSQTTFATTDTAGTATQTIVLLQASGTTQVSAEFAGTTDYKPNAAFTDFTILREGSILAYTGPTPGVRGETTTLRAELGENDASLGDRSGKTVTFTLGSQTATSTTDQDGVAVAEITLNQPAGQYALQVQFQGDSYYTPSSTQTTFTVFEDAIGSLMIEGKGRIPVMGGEAKFQIDIDSEPDHNQGNIFYNDKVRGVNLHSLQITRVLDSGGTLVIVQGTAKVNGQAGYTFKVEIEDNGAGGDTFRIKIYDQYGNLFYSAGGTLTQGNITVRR